MLADLLDFISDPPGWFWLLFWLVIVLVLGLVMRSAVRAGQAALTRRRALAAWATARGWRVLEKPAHDLGDYFPDFACLHAGSERYGTNVMIGKEQGRVFFAFDYRYQTSATNRQGRVETQTQELSAVAVRAGLHLDPLLIREQGILDAAIPFGAEDVDFESAAFNRAFVVNAADKRWAYDVLNQATMERLLHAPRFTIELQGPNAIAWRSAHFEIADFERAIDLLSGMLDGIPADVAQARKLRGS